MVYADSSGVAMYSRSRGRYGGRYKTRLWKVLKASCQPSWWRFGCSRPYVSNTSYFWWPGKQGVAPLPSDSNISVVGSTAMIGAYPLMSTRYTAANRDYYCAPLYMYDLTSLPYNKSGSNTIAGLPFFSLQFVGRNDNVERVFFRNPLGENAATSSEGVPWYEPVDIPGSYGSAINEPLRNVLLNYVNFKFMLRGGTQWPTRFRFDLIQINDDDLHPFQYTIQDEVAPTSLDARLERQSVNVIDFYRELVRPHTVSQNVAGANVFRERRRMKVLKSWTEELEPIAEKEGAVFQNRQVKSFNLSFPLNRMCRFDWDIPNSTEGDGQKNVTTANAYVLENGKNEVLVTPNARVYLMIRGDSWSTYAGAVNAGEVPSFDMEVKRKQTVVK